MTQQACVISNLSLNFPTKTLFKDLSFTLCRNQTSAIIGRNGQGKTLLMQILQEQNLLQLAYSGEVHWQMPHAYLSQLGRIEYTDDTTIAQILKVEPLYEAFQRIEHGIGSFNDYDLLEHQWHLPQLWEMQLKDAHLPTDLNFKVQYLSEGQKTKLALCRLFLLKDHFLLLDEPSNHLDADSRRWLISQIHQHDAGVLIISHDRTLLKEVDHIYALSSLGLQHVQGHYDDYQNFIENKLQALDQSIDQQKRDLKSIKAQQHEQILRMQKGSARAKKLRLSGSQSKIILDAKKAQAEHSLASIQKQQNRQKTQLQSELNLNQLEREIIKPQQFEFQQHPLHTGEILRLNHLVLIHGSKTPIHFALNANQKIHLQGKNGCGKTTLLNLIRSRANEISKDHSNTVQANDVFLNARIAYLEQNLQILDPKLSAIESLAKFNEDFSATEWRNLLGQLRIRGDLPMLPVQQLSGGEKIKIILLGLSHAKSPFHLLLLDEPENHLDIDSRNLLANAIAHFNGAVILISHDPTFVEDCGINESYHLT